eukprot:1697108-Pyramimonas_sp.AAC.1
MHNNTTTYKRLAIYNTSSSNANYTIAINTSHSKITTTTITNTNTTGIISNASSMKADRNNGDNTD